MNSVICFQLQILKKEELYLNNRPHILWVYQCDKPCGMLGSRTREKLVNHKPKASDLQGFQVLFQHPKWVITPVNQ